MTERPGLVEGERGKEPGIKMPGVPDGPLRVHQVPNQNPGSAIRAQPGGMTNLGLNDMAIIPHGAELFTGKAGKLRPKQPLDGTIGFLVKAPGWHLAD